MSLKFVIITSFALLPYETIAAPALRTYDVARTPQFNVDTIFDFKHSQHAYSNTISSNLSPHQFVHPHPSEAFPSDSLISDVASHHLIWMEKPSPHPLSKENVKEWYPTAEEYNSLTSPQKSILDQYFQDVLTEPAHQRSYDVVKWSRDNVLRAVWWDKHLVDKFAKNDEYREMVALGQALEFNHKQTPLTAKTVKDELVPNLNQILLGNTPHKTLHKRIHAIHRFTFDNGDSMYQTRILNVAKILTSKRSQYDEKAIRMLYTAVLARPLGGEPNESKKLAATLYNTLQGTKLQTFKHLETVCNLI